MTKYGGAASPAGKSGGQVAESASSVFQHLGEASQRLMELQAQAAALVLMDSAGRCAQLTDTVLRNFGVPQWMAMQRSQMRNAMGPMQAWMEAATGLQAVLAAGFLQGLALTVFPVSSPRDSARYRELPFLDPRRLEERFADERRVHSVVIPFPDRRRDSGR